MLLWLWMCSLDEHAIVCSVSLSSSFFFGCKFSSEQEAVNVAIAAATKTSTTSTRQRSTCLFSVNGNKNRTPSVILSNFICLKPENLWQKLIFAVAATFAAWIGWEKKHCNYYHKSRWEIRTEWVWERERAYERGTEIEWTRFCVILFPILRLKCHRLECHGRPDVQMTIVGIETSSKINIHWCDLIRHSQKFQQKKIRSNNNQLH